MKLFHRTTEAGTAKTKIRSAVVRHYEHNHVDKSFRKSLEEKRDRAKAEKAGRIYIKGKGKGDRHDALALFVKQFSKPQIEDIIK